MENKIPADSEVIWHDPFWLRKLEENRIYVQSEKISQVGPAIRLGIQTWHQTFNDSGYLSADAVLFAKIVNAETI